MTSNKIVLSLFLLAILIVGTYLLFSGSEGQQTPANQNNNDSSLAPSTNAPLPTPDTIQTQEQQAEEVIRAQLGEQIEWVVDAFEQQSRYPVYSVVVTDAELAMPLAPFAEARVEMPTFSRSGDLLPITIAASVDKLNYVVGEDIIIQLQIAGADANTNVFATANVKAGQGSNLLPQDLDLMPSSAGQAEFRATTNSEDINLKASSQELIARIEVEIDGQAFVTTVPFFLSKASAMIENVGTSEQKDDHLLIPLEYDVFESGYYFVNAFLDDASTGRPLLSLQAEGKLKKGSDELVFKAHHQALKDAGSEGPYKLRIVNSFRGAEDDEEADVQTAVSESSFDIPDFSFDGYADTPFSDPLVNEQLEALRKLSGNG